MIVGLTYNLKKRNSEVEDWDAEFDSPQTVMSIRSAIEQAGHETVLFEAIPERIHDLVDAGCEIVFNFAEGLQGRGREAQIPAILSFLGIPFTGSDEVALGIALDKTVTKQLVAAGGIATPRFQLVNKTTRKLKRDLRFPLIIKPNAEGSSKGIRDNSVVHCEEQEISLLRDITSVYPGNFIIEEFVEGREVTVGLLGNGESLRVLPILETLFPKEDNFYSFRVKKNSDVLLNYSCPAELDRSTHQKIERSARMIFGILGLKDVARMDFRIANDGTPFFLEANPIPGLAPGFSDLPRISEAASIAYEELIVTILNTAMIRHELLLPSTVGVR